VTSQNDIKSAPHVVLVILTFNCAAQARRSLQSLAQLAYANYTIMVVDNASTDGVAEIVKTEFPDAAFLQSGGNLGYTGGNNLGIRQALNQGADYVLILNPDTVLLNPQFLTEMVAYCEAQPEVGIAGPRVFLRSPEQVQNTVLYPPGLWRSLFNWVWYRLHPASFFLSKDKVIDAQVLNGVCLLLRAACLREVGLFDEAIFMYIEDADLDYRARAAGWLVQYLPIDSVIHEQKIGGYHMTSLVSFLLRRNSVYYLCKVNRRLEAWGYAIGSLAVMAMRACLTRRRAHFREHVNFCLRLARSYRQILFNQKFDAAFGPPYAGLQSLRSINEL
jgi:GT2 family glycosyltransferase